MASIWSQLGQHIIRGKGLFSNSYIVVKLPTEEELIKFLWIAITCIYFLDNSFNLTWLSPIDYRDRTLCGLIYTKDYSSYFRDVFGHGKRKTKRRVLNNYF